MGDKKETNQLMDKLKGLRSRVPGTEVVTAQPRAVRMVIVGITFILYVFIYLPVDRLTGAASILALVPVALAGRLLGLQAGLLAGLMSFPLNMVLLVMVGQPASDIFLGSSVIGLVALVLVGGVVGRLTDLGEKLHEELSRRHKVEEVLRESEEKYRTIIEDIEEGYYEVDLAGNFTFFNDATCKIIGYSKDEMMGMNYRQYMDGESAEDVYQTFNAIFRTGKPRGAFGWEIIRKDGAKRFIEASVSMKTGVTGKPSGFRGIVRDISESKRIDEALKESEAQYKDLVERAGIGIVIDDLEGNFAYFNDRYAEMFGYSMEEMREQTIESTTHLDDVERVLGFHHDRIKGKDVPSRYEVRGIRKDGSVFHLEIDVVLLEKDGIAIGTRTYLWDISGRVLARELLQQSEASYRGIFNGVQDAILVESLEGEILDANPRACEIFGWSREEMLTKAVSDLVPEGQLAVIPSEITETDLLDFPIETINMRANGEFFPVEFTTRIQTIGDETVMLIVLRDITERKRIEESLEHSKLDLIRSNKDLELFAYAISHDLQEPLRMVASYVELLEKRYKNQLDTEAHEFIDFAVDGARRMQGMIKGLLELSRIDTRGKPPAPTDTQNVLDQASDNLQVAIENSGLIITHDPLPTMRLQIAKPIPAPGYSSCVCKR